MALLIFLWILIPVLMLGIYHITEWDSGHNGVTLIRLILVIIVSCIPIANIIFLVIFLINFSWDLESGNAWISEKYKQKLFTKLF